MTELSLCTLQGRVQALTSQQSADVSRLGGPVGLLEDRKLVFGTVASAPCLGGSRRLSGMPSARAREPDLVSVIATKLVLLARPSGSVITERGASQLMLAERGLARSTMSSTE